MKKTEYIFIVLILLFFISPSGNILLSQQNAPIIIDLENGVVGSDFEIATEGNTTFIQIMTNGTMNNPQSADRVVTVEATFPAEQQYDLYVRCRVGSGQADDDSFFYGNGFGTKDPAINSDWIRVNNIYVAGYTGGSIVVDGGGSATGGVWKWINLSEFQGDAPPLVFDVQAGGLTQTFQIGAREDGLQIDKIAFTRADYFFTVNNLDLAQDGSPTNGGGETTPPIAHCASRFIGNVYSTSQLPEYLNYWNQVTPENAGKWGSVEATQDVMNWAELDNAYDLAKDNDLYFKFHVLIWGNQQPAWIENLSPAEQLAEIEEWFAAVAERYPDIDAIEVVNEPLHDPPNQPGNGGGNYIEALGGAGDTGWDWIITAFEMAREHFPNAQLMINDYNIINSTSATNNYIEIIELLQAQDLIDQIGVQAHAFTTFGTSAFQLDNNLDALAATGLPIYVTELDIDGQTDQVQLDEYKRVFPVLWEHEAVQGITLWGYRPGMWRTPQGAYLIEMDWVTERPAMLWLRNYVCGTLSDNEVLPANHISIFPNPISFGDLTIEGMDRIEKVELIDMNGRIIWSGTPDANSIQIKDNLAQGLYILRLYDTQHVFSKKLIVK